MALRFRLQSNHELPLGAQIVHQVREAIARGTLKPGGRLPTVRELSQELLVNSNTVAKAYQDLEREGVIVTRRGAGSFAAEPHCALGGAERERIVVEKIDACLTEAVHLQVTRKGVQKLFEKGLDRYRWPDDGGKTP